MKNICKKSIVISIILLLIGVSLSSAISVDTKSSISNNKNKECRSCEEVSRSDLICVERLLDRVEVYSKLLLVLGKYNPELKELSEEILNNISKLSDMIKGYEPYDRPICNFLETCANIVYSIMCKLDDIIEILKDSPFRKLGLILDFINEFVIIFIFDFFYGIGVALKCWDSPWES